MIRNLAHAAIGVALILVIGWLVAQPSAGAMAHDKHAHLAVDGVLGALALFVLFSVVRAFKGGKAKKTARPSSSYAAPAGRK